MGERIRGPCRDAAHRSPGVGFFLYEGVFAPLNDAGALLVGSLLAPLVWSTYVLSDGARLNRAVFGVGVVTVAGICIGSFGLVAQYLLSPDPVTYGAAFLSVQFLGWFLLGFWLLGVGVIGLRTTDGRRYSWAAVVAGVGACGGISTLVYSYAVGSFTPAFPFFMALFAVGFVLWAFWFEEAFRRTVPVREDAPS